MNTNLEPFYELSDGALDRAIRAVIELPPPEDVKNRVLQKAAALGASDMPSRAFLGRMTWTKSAWLAAVSAAAVVLVALIFFTLQPPGVAWSQVAEAVRALPWVHLKFSGGDDRFQTARETWLSFSRKITADRDNDTAHYDDYSSGIGYEYSFKQKKLFRLSASQPWDFKPTVELFETIFRGNALGGGDFLGLCIAKQKQRTVNEEGRRWTLYEFELEPPADVAKPPELPTTSVVIRVNADNPAKLLPDSATITQGKLKLKISFDFPAEGPTDIYALGVPRDAALDDRTPPPDLNRILKIVRENRRGFGDYLAIAGDDWSYNVQVIRCKNDKFRIDIGFGMIRGVASGGDMEKWWREHARETLPEDFLLCDGRRVYQRSAVHPEAGWEPLLQPVMEGDGRLIAGWIRKSTDYYVDLLAYPVRLDPQNLVPSPLYTATLDPKGENGPAGSVRIILQRAKSNEALDRNVYHKEEFWLHPKYGYAVVKHVLSECPMTDEDPQEKVKRIVRKYDGFRQTPHGVWYPTVFRRKNERQTESKDKPGGIEFRDKVTYFYLDFTAKLADELFTTAWQGDPLAGINFPPGGGGAAANFLRTARPPGGVPLYLGGPGKPLSVEALNRCRERLKAVPPADLEKWVVELERIIGKKLKDGLPSDRQVCRTDFAIHMSLAFEGVKWNAERADELFKRAQTLPPSAAKTWKEAFEAVLKKKIGQTNTTIFDGGPDWAVPLVLIPVDSFYDGQKYSPELANKYLARLKQLTADDVSLWLDKIDQWGSTKLDAAVIIVSLDYFFDKERFQRDKFQAAIKAGRQ